MTKEIRGWDPDSGTPPPAPCASDDADPAVVAHSQGVRCSLDDVHRALLRDIDRRFTYSAPKDDQPERYVALRREARDLAWLIVHLCPNSRERALALTNLEQVVMWANASIARNE